jgi:DNA-binding MarR family transcriptional regulator
MDLTGISEEYKIYGELFSLSNKIQTIGDKEFPNITMKQHFLMIALGLFQNPPTLKELSMVVGSSYQNVKRMAANLQKEGYLEIRQDCNDKRKLLIVSTGKIDMVENSNHEKTIFFMTQLYKSISREDLVTTLNTLMKMNQNIEALMK